jgi:hypothetical protein
VAYLLNRLGAPPVAGPAITGPTIRPMWTDQANVDILLFGGSPMLQFGGDRRSMGVGSAARVRARSPENALWLWAVSVAAWNANKILRIFKILKGGMVEPRGIEPLTS